MFSYTDVAKLAAKRFHGDRSAVVEALLRNGPNMKYGAQPGVCRRKTHRCLVGRGAVAPATFGHGGICRLATQRARHHGGQTSERS